MKIIRLAIVLLIVSCQSISAESYRITNPDELSTLKSLQPGDIVVLAPGIYDSRSMQFSANGTAEAPIILEGEKPGEVIFTGKSLLKLTGNYIVVRDLYFKNLLPVSGKSPIEMRTKDSKLENCVITGVDSKEDPATDNKWVSIYGERNTVEKCTFTDKKNIGCLLVVWLEKDIIPNHKILNNYFSRPTIIRGSDGSKTNGQECVRIGTSDFSMQEARCLVANNTFYRCDAEIEVISNKSCYNNYINNLFLETQGALTLRHGNNSLVEANYFIGNNREGTAGIRVIGDHQTIRNNYFENGTGENYQAAICLIQGVKNSPLNRYFQVTDSKIEGNIIKNCNNGIVISYGNAPDQSLPVISTEIINNIIYNDNSSNYSIVWVDNPEKPQITFRNNVIYGGRFNNFNAELSPMTNEKPVIGDMTEKWKSLKNNSGAVWAKNVINNL